MGFYSYNGYILPELPYWDTITYPYAAIMFYGNHEYGFSANLLCIDKPFEYDATTGYFVPADANCIRYLVVGHIDTAIDDWGDPELSGVGLNRYDDGSCFVWTNQNVYSTTGSLYLKATDPEPIEFMEISGDYMYLGDLSRKAPEWPEWNKTKYPHAIVVKYTSGNYEIYTVTFSSLPFRYEERTIAGGLKEIEYSSPSGAKHCMQHYVNAFDRPIWSAPYLAEGSLELSAVPYFGSYNWEVVWHTGLYNEAGALVEEPSPQPRTKYPIADWVAGYVLGTLETPQVAFRSPWPIEWSYPEVLDNDKIETASGYAALVSGYVMSAEEYQYLVLEVTENGVVSTYRFEEVFISDSALDSITMGDNSEYSLMNIKKVGGSYQKVGIYALYLKSNTTPRQFRLRLVKGD